MKKILLLLSCLTLVFQTAVAGGKKPKTKGNADTAAEIDSAAFQAMLIQAYKQHIDDTLKFIPAGNKVTIGGVATLTVPKGFKYLDAAMSKFVLEKMWENLESDASLGMLFPENQMPYDSTCWGIDITYSEEGHIKDDDASDIDYSEMLASMKKDNTEANKQRQAQGMQTLELIDYAEKPHYDAASHKLFWALDLQNGGTDYHTLNYNIRVLGRKGYIIMNAIGSMSQLKEISAQTNTVMAGMEFNDGNKYSDFDPNIDKIAAYGIGGLIAGKVLLKVGFFAKFWKIIVGLVIALGGWLGRVFFGRKKNQDNTPSTTPPPSA